MGGWLMLQILIMLGSLGLMALPFLPIRFPLTLCGYNFPEEQRHKNIIHVLTSLGLALITVLCMPLILNLADWIANLAWVKFVIDLIPSYATYSATVFKAIFANILYCALVLLCNALGGGILGLYRKGTIAQQKEAQARRKEAFRNFWKNLRDRVRQIFSPNKAQGSKSEPEPTPEPEKPKTLSPHLIPAPEKPDHQGKVQLPGKTERQARKGSRPAKKSDEKKTITSIQYIPGEEEGQDHAALQALIELFYTRAENGNWYVQPQCKKVARQLGKFLILAELLYLIVFTLLMIPIFIPVEIFAKSFYDVMNLVVQNCYLYPCISLVLLTQIYWFMNGRLPDEPVVQAQEQELRQKGRIVDLDRIELNLMQTYGQSNQVKTFHSDDVQPIDPGHAALDLTGEPLVQNIAQFAENQGLARNDDYLKGILALTRGSDVLFDAPLYTGAGTYLYPYLSTRITQGDRILVVCQDRAEIPQVIENLEQGFHRVLRTHECLWRIDRREDLRCDNQTDVLVLTPGDFLDEGLYEEGRDFFPRVTLVLLPDADRVISANNYHCLVMAQRLRQQIGKAPQYLFLSTRHTLNLSASLTQYFLLDKSLHTVHAEHAYGKVQVYVWKARNDGATLLDNSAQAVPLEVGIAKIAQAGGVPNINLISGSAIFPNQINPKWLDAYDAAERPIGFAVVADDGYNLPGVIYTYSRYMGKKASILHVISRPYMLRDYFFDRAARSLHEQPLMERGMAEHGLLQHSAMILLLCRLMNGIAVEDFARELQRLTGCEAPEELNFSALQALVDQCLRIAFGPDSHRHTGFTVWEEQDGRFQTVRKIRIVEKGILDLLLADTALVTLRFTGGRPDVRIPLFRKMLDQRYLVGQNLVYDHRNYEILRIDRANGLVLVDDASSVHNVPAEYIQVRHYSLGDMEVFHQSRQAVATAQALPDPAITGARLDIPGDHAIQSMTLVRSREALQITSDTVAYYPVQGQAERLDLTDASMVMVKTSQAQRQRLLRTVGNALYLKLEGSFPQSDQLTMTLAITLQEMMKTLFPDQHFCLAVCPILAEPERIYNHRELQSLLIAGMYPRVLNWGPADPNAIELLIVEDCEGGCGVLDLLYAPESIYLRNVLDMLSDYLSWLQEHPQDPYLHFGAEECPALYDLPGLQDLLRVFSRQYRREHDLLQNLQLTNCCAFCGNPLSPENSYLWNNRESICGHCQTAYKPTEEEAGAILDHVRKFLQDRFGITLDEGLTVLQSQHIDRSGLDMEAKQILLAADLPLVTVHSEILMQCVRLWQHENLRMTGEPEFEGQVLYVLLQYLQALQQHQRRRRLHRKALLGADQASTGYCQLHQALQSLNSQNSFQYMLQHYPKNGVPPVRKSEPRRSTRRKDAAHVRRTFYEALSAGEQRAYQLLIDGFMAMSPKISLEGCKVPKSRISVVWNSAFGDHPEIFWVLTDYSYHYDADLIITEVEPRYNMDSEERARRQTAIDEVTTSLISRIRGEMSDFDAALWMYELLADIMDYDSIALEQQDARIKALQRKKLRDDTPDDLRSIYGALVQKKAVCAGYAVAYQYLLQQIGIECLDVCGYIRRGGYHAWNIVNLEGDYYHVDVTWGDGSNTDPRKHRKYMSYNYFCLTDAEIRLSRSIDRQPPSPSCTATACNYFVRKGLFFEAYDHDAVKQSLLEQLKDPEATRLDLRFTSRNVLLAANQHLIHGGGIFEILRSSGRRGITDSFIYYPLNVLTIIFGEASPETP